MRAGLGADGGTDRAWGSGLPGPRPHYLLHWVILLAAVVVRAVVRCVYAAVQGFLQRAHGLGARGFRARGLLLHWVILLAAVVVWACVRCASAWVQDCVQVWVLTGHGQGPRARGSGLPGPRSRFLLHWVVLLAAVVVWACVRCVSAWVQGCVLVAVGAASDGCGSGLPARGFWANTASLCAALFHPCSSSCASIGLGATLLGWRVACWWRASGKALPGPSPLLALSRVNHGSVLASHLKVRLWCDTSSGAITCCSSHLHRNEPVHCAASLFRAHRGAEPPGTVMVEL